MLLSFVIDVFTGKYRVKRQMCSSRTLYAIMIASLLGAIHNNKWGYSSNYEYLTKYIIYYLNYIAL